MVIWSGWGILTVVIVALVGGSVTAILANLAGPGSSAAGYALAVGLLVSAVVNWFVGQRLNAAPGRELVDPATGQRVTLRRRHSLFFVPMQWWSVPLVVVASVALGAMLFGR
ncbi:hypothetical protein [Roseomonas elaeocarpi]|uniref:Uncharacterized protein n=1 Tax=Roseomonas elaeocarpi TaxID=907779 RepID=A0ABV6JM17_9PROT